MGATTYQQSQLETLWTQAGGSPSTAPMAAAIALAESGGKPDGPPSATNDWGLWQIHNGGPGVLNPLTNAQVAVQMSNNGANWRPWCTAYSDAACGTKGGSYLGSGAPFYQYLKGNAGTTATSPAVLASTPVSASLPSAGTGSDVLFKIPIPIPGVPDITFTHANGRAWAGAGALVAGALVIIVGLVVLTTGSAPKIALKRVAPALTQAKPVG
jgi:Lysozyme like domain